MAEDRTPRARDKKSKARQAMVYAALPGWLRDRGYIVKGTSRPRGMTMISYRLRSGEAVNAWIKIGWDPEKDQHGSSAVITDRSRAQLHTQKDVVDFVAGKAKRAADRGATHVLLVAANGDGKRLFAGRLIPIGAVEQLMYAALDADEGLTWNGWSPSLYILGNHGGEKRIADVVAEFSVDDLYPAQSNSMVGDALQDLDEIPPGVEHPGRQTRTGTYFPRDPAVREAVIRRANGRCEYCAEPGFLMGNGRQYLEAHHVIYLSEQGPDTVRNVIALCPKDHREAHYGMSKELIEEQMQQILRRINA